MKRIDVGQAATIVANLVVVASVIFPAIEIRQNQETLEERNAMNLMIAQDTAQQHYSDFR